MAELLTCASEGEVDTFLSGLSANALKALPWMFEFWALPHQIAPNSDWATWVILGGRGAGKTRAGSTNYSWGKVGSSPEKLTSTEIAVSLSGSTESSQAQ